MDTLLKAIQQALKAALTLSHLKGSVYIIPEGPDHEVLPLETKFPAIGITDGSESIQHETSKRKTVTRIVRISAFVEVLRPERSIVGDENTQGVIDILKDVQAVLDYNMLGLSGYSIAKSVSVDASTVPPFRNLLAAKKTLIMEYSSHE